MATFVKLTEVADWVEDLYEIQENDIVGWGPPDLAEDEGIPNLHAWQLGARTRILRALADAPVEGAVPASGFMLADTGELFRNNSGATISPTGTSAAALAAAGLVDTGLVSRALARGPVLALAPVFPQIETGDFRLAVTNAGGGSISVDPGQTWIWRGGRRIRADDLPTRTVVTVPLKTYHLVWHAPGTGTATPAATYPAGRLELVDMTALVEAAPQYDSRPDRMLIARIVTNGANAPTITRLANAASLEIGASISFLDATYQDDISPENITAGVDTPVNWSRRPKVALVGMTDITTAAGNDVFEGNSAIEINVVAMPLSRYTVRSVYARTQNGAAGIVRWQAWT